MTPSLPTPSSLGDQDADVFVIGGNRRNLLDLLLFDGLAVLMSRRRLLPLFDAALNVIAFAPRNVREGLRVTLGQDGRVVVPSPATSSFWSDLRHELSGLFQTGLPVRFFGVSPIVVMVGSRISCRART